MSRLTDLMRQLHTVDPQLGTDLEKEIQALTNRRNFGLVFERHQPEAVELPGVVPKRGNKVRILEPRGSVAKGEKGLWLVDRIARHEGVKTAHLIGLSTEEQEQREVAVDDLIVVAEFRDGIFPGLVETGRVERSSDKPFHTVINAENFHALEMLTYTHRGKVDAIYIDPPYNTGAKDWKYNNDYVEADDAYRHSKWLAMMERRLLVAKELLNVADSVLIVTIDEKEVHRLGILLEQTFPEAEHQMISTLINPAASARAGAFGRVDEYIFIVRFGKAVASRVSLDREWVSARGRTHTGLPRWDMLRRSGGGARRQDSPGGFYPIYVDPSVPKVVEVGEPLPAGESNPPHIDGAVPVLPIRKDGTEGRWMWSVSEFKRRLLQGRVRITGSEAKGFVVSILKDGEYAKILAGEFGNPRQGADGSLIFEKRDSESVIAIPGTQWRISSHDSTQYGSRLLRSSFLKNREFPFPKSLYAVEDTLRFFVADKPDAVVLDFFSGSGTTAHAVMRLNKQDGGRRQCISVTNNEVSAEEQKKLRKQGLRPGDPEWEALGICDYITKPRVTAAITGRTPEGDPVKGDYKFTDEFPMSDGFEENAVFFTLTYESPMSIRHGRAFERVAPMLWLRAGSEGRIITSLGVRGWDVSGVYAVLENFNESAEFFEALAEASSVRMVFFVTDDDAVFQMACRRLPEDVKPVRLYSSYLHNFEINRGRA